MSLAARLRPTCAIAGPGIAAGSRTPLVASSSSLCSRRCGLLPLQRQQQQQRQLSQQQGSGKCTARPARRGTLQCSASAAAGAVWAAASFDAPGNSGGGAGSADRADWRRFPAFLAAIRAVLFYTTTFIFATPLFCLMLLVYPYVLKFDKFRWVLDREGACVRGYVSLRRVVRQQGGTGIPKVTEGRHLRVGI